MCYAATITCRVADEIFGMGKSNLSKSSYITLVYTNVIHSAVQTDKQYLWPKHKNLEL